MADPYASMLALALADQGESEMSTAGKLLEGPEETSVKSSLQVLTVYTFCRIINIIPSIVRPLCPSRPTLYSQ